MENTQKTIVIDARFYGEAGPGRYIKNILFNLEKLDSSNKYIVLMREKGAKLYNPTSPNFSKVLAEYRWYSWSEQTGFLFKILSYKPDLLYVPHFNIPVLFPGKLVTAIPDIIMHTFSTEQGTTLPKLYFRFKKLVYRLVVAWAVIRSYRVIVPSIEVKKEFLKTFKFSKDEKYLVSYEGVDPDFIDSSENLEDIKDKTGINRQYILHVGSMYSHKNVPALIKAFKQFIEQTGFDGLLVLIGKKDKYSALIADQIKNYGLEHRILIPGEKAYISDKEIVMLRKNALFCVFPSLKEGFSLTPLESQAVGLPCVISDIPVHREVYGESVMYFDPLSIDDIAEKMGDLYRDPQLRESFVKKGYDKVKEYSWYKTAQETLEIFERALDNA
jgi:glycosyltransferase involved in cell wall biosynthesis